MSDDMIPRSAASAMAAIIEQIESAKTERCQKCGHPRNDHHYRHLFVHAARRGRVAAAPAADKDRRKVS